MQTEMLTEEEVKDYINSQYEYLNLTQREFDRYVKFILKIDCFKSWNAKLKNIGNAFDFFESKFNQVYDLFLQEGYTPETSLELAKKGVLYADRRDFIVDFHILRMLGFEEKVIRDNILLYRRVPEKIHAKKCYLVDCNNQKNQTITNLCQITDKEFERKFSVSVTNLLKKYPLTEETKMVWAYLSKLKDHELFSEFKLTREEMATIYPTNKDQLSVLKKIANLSDDEIQQAYGVTRQELLKKHPLNNDTLTALRSIQCASDTKVKKIFQQSKEEVLHLRTITTEMIKSANEQIKLQRGTYSKEELLEKMKCMKKGTYPNR